MHARMRRLVWSGDGTYVRRRRPWPARGKICACAFLVYHYAYHCFPPMSVIHSVCICTHQLINFSKTANLQRLELICVMAHSKPRYSMSCSKIITQSHT